MRAKITVSRSDILFDKIEVESFAGKPLYNLDYALSRLRMGLNLVDDDVIADLSGSRSTLILDCEIQVNGNFTDTIRYVRSSASGVPDDLVGKEVAITLLDAPLSPYPQNTRLDLLTGVAYSLSGTTTKDITVGYYIPITVRCQSEEAVFKQNALNMACGYEGSMVKSPDALYQPGKRSRDWLKIKPVDTADAVITGFDERISVSGEPQGIVGSIKVRTEDGSTADVAGLKLDLAKEMWTNQDDFIGRWLEFEYMERTPGGAFRHPRFVRLREDKE